MSDEVERGCGGVPVDDDRLRVHCSRCYRFDTVADHLERARAESASLRERAKRAEAEGDELRGLLTAWGADRVVWLSSERPGRVCCDCGVWTDIAIGTCIGHAARRWLASHPAIPEGTPTATDPVVHAQDCLNSCRFVLGSKDWCGVCRIAEDRAPEGPPPGERGTP